MILSRCLCLLSLLCSGAVIAGDWEPKDQRLLTRWVDDIDPTNPHPEYPRPQLERDSWLNLNGVWDYAITPREQDPPSEFDGEILVPFCVESALSGVAKRVGQDNVLWYRRKITIPDQHRDDRVLLHFGAVDWETTVWIDEKEIGTHRGGYDPFRFDITDALGNAAQDGNEVELVIRVWDPTDQGSQPAGKQRNEPGGIWYTPVTGIWQTVWLEFVSKAGHIESVLTTTEIETEKATIQVATSTSNDSLKVTAKVTGFSLQGDMIEMEPTEAVESGENELTITIPNAPRWTPSEPWLCHLDVSLVDDSGKEIDQVKTYFGMRKVALGKDRNGIHRIMLNDQPLFQFGPLDQGWWPDGLYTAPTDEAMKYDLEVTKKLGFNMVRKHVKVEPRRWYHWCDVNGLLVWQDLPNGGKHAPWPRDGVEIQRDIDSAKQYEAELKSMIDAHRNHPSIVMWVPFNEAWGQYDTVRIANWIKQYDPTRLVNAASGGNDFLAGDIDDDHFYPGPGASPVLPKRAVVLGEYGGLGLPIQGHTWQEKENWGYRSYEDSEQLTTAYVELVDKLKPLVESHVAAAVYTQTTDVEVEVNGLLTYDRRQIKMNEEQVTTANKKLFDPIPEMDAATKNDLSTLAWWRFEDGEPTKHTPNTKQHPKQMAAKDFSGHNNHLYAFGPEQSPKYGSRVPRQTMAFGIENKVCLDDSVRPIAGVPTRDLFTDFGRSKTHMDVLNTFQFRHWTVELSFKLSSGLRDQCLLGKDGNQGAEDAPLQFTVDGMNHVRIDAIDSAGKRRIVTSKNSIEAKRWFHAAAVSNGATLKLYVDRGAGYELEGESPFEGQLINTNGTWTVGRGYKYGKIGWDARAWIDEIRISASARTPSEFLFAK